MARCAARKRGARRQMAAVAAVVGAFAVGAVIAPAPVNAADTPEVLVRVGDLVIPAGTVVHGNAIALGGTLDVEGTVEGDAIASGGGIEIGGRVTGSVHAFGGGVHLRSTAVVGGTVAAWGGRVRADPGASMGGTPRPPSPGAPPGTPPGAPGPPPAGPSFPIPVPGPQPAPFPAPWGWLPGVFGVVAMLHALYWLIALVSLVSFVGMAWLTAIFFPGTVAALAADLDRAPGAAFAVGLLGWVLLWPAVAVLALTIAGLALVILIPAVLFIMLQFGTTAVALFAGRRIRRSGIGREVLVGSVVLAIGFAVPHLGWLLVMAVATWGWGAVLLALIERIRIRRIPPPPAPA